MRLMLLILAAFAGCATAPATTEPLRDRDWSLVWIDGFQTLPSGAATPTIRFGTDDRLTGNTGCNQAGASYTANGDSLTIGALMTTKRACIEPQGNELERAYVRAVEAAERYHITNGELELLDASGGVVARFRAQNPTP